MTGGVKRSVRLAEAMREELARLLLLEVKDPRVAGVVVTAVDLTPDLREARVYYVIEGQPDDERRKTIADGLRRVAGFLRREVGRAIRARHAPELEFVFDESVERGARMEKLLSDIREGE